MKLYVYRLTLLPRFHDFSAWDDKVQDAFKQHGEFLERGIRDGRIHFVGRTDAELRDNFGIVLYEAADQADADAYMNADPAIMHGIMSARAFPFKLLKVSETMKRWNTW